MAHRKLFSESKTFNLTSDCDPCCDPKPRSCPEVCRINWPLFCSEPQPPGGIIITVDYPVHRSNKLRESLIISFSFIGLCCFIFGLFTLYKIYKRKRRPLREERDMRDVDGFVDEEHGPIVDHPIWYIRTVGLPTSTIDLITTFKYKRGERLIEGTDCSVCLSEFEDDETLRLLPKCNHAFHLPCIDTWLRSHTNCPMCRAPILSNPNSTLSPILEQSFGEDSVAVDDSQAATIPETSVVRERENGDEEIGEVQPMKRSVSMDSLAASRLSSAVANAQSDMSHGLKRFMGSYSFRKGPVLMKRSVSCSGKVLFPRQNQDMNSVLPL